MLFVGWQLILTQHAQVGVICLFDSILLQDAWLNNLVFDENREIIHLIPLVLFFPSEFWTSMCLFKKCVAAAICWMECACYSDTWTLETSELSVPCFF